MIKLNLCIGEGDPQESSYSTIAELVEYLEYLKAFDCIWLATTEGENAEILVTESIDLICECVKNGFFSIPWHFYNQNANRTPINFFVQEYQTFEAAYDVALSMREGHDKCYD